jgi:hypothetical protein
MIPTRSSNDDSDEVRKICDIAIIPYGDCIDNVSVCCEPTRQEICDALNEGHLETRNYQNDLEALKSEWFDASRGATDIDGWKKVVTRYHARRIAYFVANGWDDPIIVGSDGRISDGSHRIRAAMFTGMQEIKVRIQK